MIHLPWAHLIECSQTDSSSEGQLRGTVNSLVAFLFWFLLQTVWLDLHQRLTDTDGTTSAVSTKARLIYQRAWWKMHKILKETAWPISPFPSILKLKSSVIAKKQWINPCKIKFDSSWVSPEFLVLFHTPAADLPPVPQDLTTFLSQYESTSSVFNTSMLRKSFVPGKDKRLYQSSPGHKSVPLCGPAIHTAAHDGNAHKYQTVLFG